MLVLPFICCNTSVVELCLVCSLSRHSLYSLPSKIQALSLSQGATGLLSVVEAKGPSVLWYLVVVCVPHLDKGSCHPLCSWALPTPLLLHFHVYICVSHFPVCQVVCALYTSPSHHPPVPSLPSLLPGPIVGFPCLSLVHAMSCATCHL